jgi:hypothetical protein
MIMGNDSMLNHEDTIFHYTKMHTAIENILYKKRLRFSKSVKTNDPREYKEWYFSVSYQERAADNYSTISNSKSLEVCHTLKKIMGSDYKLACFCSNRPSILSEPDGKPFLNNQPIQYGYDRLRMWSQYGDKFSGVSIAFSLVSLIRQLRDQLGQAAYIYHNCVNYVHNLYSKDLSILMLNGKELLGKSTDDYANDYVRSNIENIFFTKHIDYKDENE